jgi:hypothetical protein
MILLNRLWHYTSPIPTGYGNSGYPGPATSRRGNPAKKDAYSYLNVEIAYKFEFRKGVPRLWGAR